MTELRDTRKTGAATAGFEDGRTPSQVILGASRSIRRQGDRLPLEPQEKCSPC